MYSLLNTINLPEDLRKPVGCGELANRINCERCGSCVTASYPALSY